uniref:RNA binding motif protein 26 n=1 Tax=Oryzias sinensis TaxID=183150 RepID=A0A8C7YLW2_9TELE
MLIENLDAFKTWLSETLEPICDADPSALAKYVAALVKKDKSEKELKALCIDQLDVFLQKGMHFINISICLFTFLCSQRPVYRDSGKLKYDHDRGERPEGVDVYAPPSLVSAATTSHFPVQTLSSAITVIAPTHHHSNNTTESWSEFHSDRPVDHGPFNRGPPAQQRKRCRDYDEKGFCMRGDMCPFDHGSDPVVVEDVNLPSMLPFQPPPIPVVDQQPPPGPPPPPLINPPPMNLRPPVPPPGTLPPSLPPVAGPPPPLPPLQPAGMDAPPSSITSAVPTIVTSGIRSSIPQAPLYRHRVNVQRPNLIGLTMSHVDHPPREKIPNNSMRIVMESDSRKRPAVSHDALVSKKTWFERSSFNNPNHQGYHKRTPFSLNTKLLVRQIPPELNNISKLNEHFSKFGTIVNLQVAYQNDPEGALIQFAFPEEAERAMQSTEAVLNNRFIKVHWFRGDRSDGQTQSRLQQSDPQPAAVTIHLPETSVKQSIKDRLGPMLPVNSEPSQESSAASQVLVGELVGKVFSTSTGLTKTVYNPTALKAAQRTSDEALKKKQEALKLQQDVRKKKQEILEKHIETQKLLISRLEKNKGMKAEDKAKIMKTLDTLTKSITKLQEEIKGISSFVNPLRTAKSKVQAQKELLDIELELYQKTQAGEDTALLKIKYTQLQIEAAKRGLLSPGRGRGVHAAGHSAVRARGRGSRGRGRGMPMHAVVDHRPRALEISGFNDEDRVNLLPHFAQYGEIEDCQMDENSPTAVVTYKTRAEAERAALHGLRFNNQTLRLAWHKPAMTLSTAEEEEEPQEDESLSDDALLQDDDEEEDDNEPRSWRR